MTNEVETQSHMGHMIPEIPDPNTLEVATYGSEYARVKATLYVLDMMEEIFRQNYNMAVAGIHGERYERVSRILRTRPFVIRQDRPHVESYEEIQDIRVVKNLVSKYAALQWVRKTRREIETYGVIAGTQEYGRALLESGLTNELYRRAIRERASRGFTGDYDSVRRIRDGRDPLDDEPEDVRAIREMNEMILLSNEYARSLRDYPEDGTPVSDIAEGVPDDRDWLDTREEDLREEQGPTHSVDTDHDPMASEPESGTVASDAAVLGLVPDWTDGTDVPSDGAESEDLAQPDRPENPDVPGPVWDGGRLSSGGTSASDASMLVPHPLTSRVRTDDERSMLLPDDPELCEVMHRRLRGEEIARIRPWSSSADDAHWAVCLMVDGVDLRTPRDDDTAWFDALTGRYEHRYELDDGSDLLIIAPGGDDRCP